MIKLKQLLNGKELKMNEVKAEVVKTDEEVVNEVRGMLDSLTKIVVNPEYKNKAKVNLAISLFFRAFQHLLDREQQDTQFKSVLGTLTNDQQLSQFMSAVQAQQAANQANRSPIIQPKVQ